MTGSTRAAERGSGVFPRVWTASTVSAFGTAVTTVALPLVAIYALHASTLEIGLVSASTVAAWLFFGLPAGVIVYRLHLRATLICADLVRAVFLASVPVAALLHVLTLAQLIVVALVIGVASVAFDVGFATYMPAVVPKDQLIAKNSLMQGSESVSQVGGPAIGGVLVQFIGAPATLLVDAVSYLVSAVCLFAVRTADEVKGAPPAGRLVPLIKEGLRYVRRDPVVGPFALAATSLNFTIAALDALAAVFLVRTLHASPGLVGVLIASAGLGGVLGAALATPLTSRLGTARAAVVAMIAAPVFALLVPMTVPGAGFLLFVLGNVGLAAATVVFSVIARTHRQVAVPPELLSRVMATVRFVSWGAMPIGGAVAGVLGQLLGIRPALWVICALLVLGPLFVLASPVRGRRDLVEAG